MANIDLDTSSWSNGTLLSTWWRRVQQAIKIINELLNSLNIPDPGESPKAYFLKVDSSGKITWESMDNLELFQESLVLSDELDENGKHVVVVDGGEFSDS